MRKVFLSFIVVGLLSTISKAATITLTIDDAIYQRVVDDFSLQNNYQSKISQGGVTVTLIDNPEKKDKFMTRLIGQFIIQNAVAAEANTATRQAAQASVSDIQNQLAPLVTADLVSNVIIK